MVLYPIHVIMMAVRQSKQINNPGATSHEESINNGKFDVKELKPFLKQAMWYDVRKSLDRDLKVLQAKINNEFFKN